VASVADGDPQQHPDEDDQGQSLRAHALPHSNARKACAIWRCKKTVIARGSDRVTAPAKIGASSIRATLALSHRMRAALNVTESRAASDDDPPG
jgi:hypothetical protein